ncbi:MAG: DUF2341 domain-containing protein [Clostridia bacterium]|nr:DUF2341 domain-containing protein [Clostridia bacterium]
MKTNKTVIRAVYDNSLKKMGQTKHFDGDIEASVYASWNAKKLSLTIISDEAKEYTIELDGYEKTLASKGNATAIVIDTEDTAINFRDGGQVFPIAITASSDKASASLSGVFVLCDEDIIFSLDKKNTRALLGNIQRRAVINPEMDPEITDFGVAEISDGFQIFDRFNENSPNFPHTVIDIESSDIEGFDGFDINGKDMSINMTVCVDSFPSMDYMAVRGTESAYGLSFILCGKNGERAPFFGFQRNNSGMYMYVNGGNPQLTQLSDQIDFSVPFDLRVVIKATNKAIIMINGKTVMKTTVPTIKRESFGSRSLHVRWSRSRYAPQSHADDLDVKITDLCVCEDNTVSVADSFDVMKELFNSGLQKIGNGIYFAPSEFIAPNKLINEKYGLELPLFYSSSSNALISVSKGKGSFTNPIEKTEFVSLSLICDSFKENINFIVPKKDTAPKTTFAITGDLDPFVNKDERIDGVFNLSDNFASVVKDMGEKTKICGVTLKTATADVGLVNKNHLSVFVSEDGESYEYVREYSLLTKGNTAYIYNLDIDARYVKIHSTTNGLSDTGCFIGCSEEMIDVITANDPLLSEGEFTNKTIYSLENDEEKEVYDKIIKLSFDEMRICACDLKQDKSDIRFFADGKWLPHYFDGEKFYVRVFRLAPKSTTNIEIFYGNEKAESVSDGNETFEIKYGLKHARRNHEAGWFNSVATMPNGDILRIVDLPSGEGKRSLAMYRSKNGGLSWSNYEIIPGTDMIRQGGGFLVDKKNGKVFYFAYHFNENVPRSEKRCKYKIFVSEDNGYTWSGPMEPIGNVRPVPDWSLSYSDGITLSCEDGDGPNVDYVFTTGACLDIMTSAYSSSAIYSKDGGKTWIFSDSRVNYEPEDTSSRIAFEGGCSEETVWEKEDGTLIMYSRCQIDEIVHFAVSYSYDHGITWGNVRLSDIYTCNTQPIISPLDKTPVFLWGGNNSLGGRTYLRYPLNMAVSTDDAESFHDLIDASLQTCVATVNTSIGALLHTNPDLTFGSYRGEDMAYIVSTRHQMYILDPKNYLSKTRGAFDSFESGASAEGWLDTMFDTIPTAEIGATDGKKAMLLNSGKTVTRPLHYIEKGEIGFDLYTSNIGDGFTIDLQTAFNDKPSSISTPISLKVDNEGNISIFGRSLEEKISHGMNKINIFFNGREKTASLTLNGKMLPLDFVSNDAYISYVTVFLGKDAKLSMDTFFAIREDI